MGPELRRANRTSWWGLEAHRDPGLAPGAILFMGRLDHPLQ